MLVSFMYAYESELLDSLSLFSPFAVLVARCACALNVVVRFTTKTPRIHMSSSSSCTDLGQSPFYLSRPTLILCLCQGFFLFRSDSEVLLAMGAYGGDDDERERTTQSQGRD